MTKQSDQKAFVVVVVAVSFFFLFFVFAASLLSIEHIYIYRNPPRCSCYGIIRISKKKKKEHISSEYSIDLNERRVGSLEKCGVHTAF